MASILNIPIGIDWPVSWRQKIGGVTYGFILREMIENDGTRTTMISVDRRGQRKITGFPILPRTAVGDRIVDLDIRLFSNAKGDEILRATEDRVRRGDVVIFALEE